MTNASRIFRQLSDARRKAHAEQLAERKREEADHAARNKEAVRVLREHLETQDTEPPGDDAA